MQFNGLMFVVGGLVVYFSAEFGVGASHAVMITGRGVLGFASGFISVVAPVYLVEIAPAHLRGAFSACNQMAVVTGILISNVCCAVLQLCEFGADAMPDCAGCNGRSWELCMDLMITQGGDTCLA